MSLAQTTQPAVRGAATGLAGRGGSGEAIELDPYDKPALLDPPADFRAKRENIAPGMLTNVQYDSKSLGTRRNLYVYTRAGHSLDSKFPVLYLLHGSGGDYNEWLNCGAEHVLNNLMPDGKIQPVIETRRRLCRAETFSKIKFPITERE